MATRTPFGMNPREWFRNELQNFFRDVAGARSPGEDQRSARRWRRTGVFPPVNIYDDGEAFRIRAEIPGVDKDDLEVNAEGEQLVIRGERTIDPPDEDADWHRRERDGGEFARTVRLPEMIDTGSVQAKLDQGVLDIYAPRTQQEQPRQIDIQT